MMHASVYPVVVAAGIALLAFGLLTSIVFCPLGLVVLASGLGGWIGELRSGHVNEESGGHE
jgi:hypothetical protein